MNSADSPIAALDEVVERLDHVCIAVADIAASLPLVELMGGRFLDGGDSKPGAFRAAQFRLPGGAKLELIQPVDLEDEDHFLVRFLDRSGPGIHHITLKVTDLAKAIDRARELGFEVVGEDRSGQNWNEAFVHPRSAQGVLIQLAEWYDLADATDRSLADVLEGVPDRYL